MRRTPRGQATTEMALGMMVFVTVLMFGIHFSEVMMAQLKVTEANSSTMWDITAGKMHQWGLVPNISDTTTSMNQATAMGNARYANFDGRVMSSLRRTAPALTQVLTSGRNMSVRCGTNAGLSYFPSLAIPFLRISYLDNGGVECRAEAEVFHGGAAGVIGGLANDASGFFKAKNYDAQGAAATGRYMSCSMGRANGGSCTQDNRMLVDDWGMSNGNSDEADICPVVIFGIPCAGFNLPYWWSVNKVYTPISLLFGVQSNNDRTLLRQVYGQAPAWIPILSSPTSFYLSFTGEPTFMTLIFWGTDNGWFSWFWQTSPFLMWPTYGASYALSDGHYLGHDTSSSANRP